MQEVSQLRRLASVVAVKGELRAEYSRNNFSDGFVF
jgi:hypothetical protein